MIDLRAIAAVAGLLADWRESRFGMTHVELPRERRFRHERRFREWNKAPSSI